MHKAEQLSVLKQLLQYLDAGTTADAGGVRRNPVDVYTCPELAQRERQLFFRQTPLLVGLSSELSKPGSYWAHDELGIPALLVRGEDGVFRAFLNVCRHRGSQVVANGRGRDKRFYCPFHAWGYDTQGALVSIPHASRFGDIDRSCHGLTPLPAAEKYGMLWMTPAPGGEIDIDDQLDTLAPEMESWRLDRLRYVGGQAIPAEINWKLAVDTFGENYHFEVLHRDTLANLIHGNLQTSDHFGRHYRMVFAAKNIDRIRDLPEVEWPFRHVTLSVYFLYPNVILVMGRYYIDLLRILPHPTDPTKSVTYQSSYLDPEKMPPEAHLSDMQNRIEAFNTVIRNEDYANAANAQRGLQSGAQTHLLFGRNEPALHHYHNTFRDALGMELLPLEQR